MLPLRRLYTLVKPVFLSMVVVAFSLGGGGCQSTGSSTASIPLPAHQPTLVSAGPEGEHRALTPGERVDIYVLEDDTYSGRYIIGESGSIIFSRIGRIPVAGQSPKQAEKTIKARLERNQLTTATVIVERSSIGGSSAAAGGDIAYGEEAIVYVTGFVAKPGRVSLPRVGEAPPTVFQAVIEAGGFMRFADKKRVVILRRTGSGETARMVVDVAAIQRGESTDVPVASGDMIVVSEKAFGF